MPTFAFDVEAAPLPEDVIRDRIKPFEDKPFKEHSGHKPETNKKNRELYESPEAVAEREVKYFEDKINSAGLVGQFCRVLCISYKFADGDPFVEWADSQDDEAGVLESFWKRCRKAFGPGRRGDDGNVGAAIGFNIDSYDLPILWQRSLANDLHPDTIVGRKVFAQARYPNASFVDLLRYWEGPKWSPGHIPSINLDGLAKTLGAGRKVTDGGINGKNFHLIAATDRPRATRYAEQDANVCWNIAHKLGVFYLNRAPASASFVSGEGYALQEGVAS